ELCRALPHTRLRESPCVGAERVGRQDLRSARGVVAMNGPDELRVLEQGQRAPERQLRIGIPPLQLRAHGGIQQERSARTQTLPEPFGKNAHSFESTRLPWLQKIRPDIIIA